MLSAVTVNQVFRVLTKSQVAVTLTVTLYILSIYKICINVLGCGKVVHQNMNDLVVRDIMDVHANVMSPEEGDELGVGHRADRAGTTSEVVPEAGILT